MDRHYIMKNRTCQRDAGLNEYLIWKVGRAPENSTLTRRWITPDSATQLAYELTAMVISPATMLRLGLSTQAAEEAS